MSIQPKFEFVLEYVNDVEAAKRFYETVMGLKVQRYHPTFVQFDKFAIASDASLTGTREPEIYWLVEDIEAAFQELASNAEIAVPLKDMPFGRVFAVREPSGRPRFLLQYARQRPSQPIQ